MSKKLTIPQIRELAKATPLNRIAPLAGCSYQNLHKLFSRNGWPFLKVYEKKEPEYKDGIFNIDEYFKNTPTL